MSVPIIERVETLLVDVPTVRPHRLAVATMHGQTLMLVRVVASDGVVGLGEGTTIGGLAYGDESPETMKLAIDTYIAPLLAGQDAAMVAMLMARVRKHIRGNRFAKCAIETALLDAHGRRTGLAVSELLGGRRRDRLLVAWTLASGDTQTDIVEAERMLELRRHRVFKLKIGSRSVDEDVAHVAAIKRALGERAAVRVDVNMAWSETQAAHGLPALADAGRELVEQPVATVAALARLVRRFPIALMADESQLRQRRPRSETLERLARQLLLPFGTIPSSGQGAGASARPKADKRKIPRDRKGRHPGRALLPAHLERNPVPNPVPPEMRRCPRCGTEMTTVGHSSCEILSVIPARVVVNVRLDERVACPNDHSIVTAPTPPAIVERGKLADPLIVEATCDKYLEHAPIERQCVRFARQGVEIAPQTLGRSVAAHLDLLAPLARQIEHQTRGPGLLATDATGIPILDPDAADGIRSGAMWCWNNGRWVTFFYSPSADSLSVRRFLGDDLARTVQCDGTSVTSFLEKVGGKRPGCWSHGRRRLVEAARAGDAIALEGVRLIAPIFAIERESTLAGDTAEQRRARRDQKTRPVLEELRRWLDHQREVIPPKTPLGRGLGYLHRQWHRLILFLEDGNIEATNNRRYAERGITTTMPGPGLCRVGATRAESCGRVLDPGLAWDSA
jgi:L-alanine-DL-glutamate epimerase-like enolase superfamily enzyme/transposase